MRTFLIYLIYFLITGLCNSLANSWFDIISSLNAQPANLFVHVAEILVPESFLSKNL